MWTVWMRLMASATLPLLGVPISREYLAEWWIVMRLQPPPALVNLRGTGLAAFQAERNWIESPPGGPEDAAGADGLAATLALGGSAAPRSASIWLRPFSARTWMAGFTPGFSSSARNPASAAFSLLASTGAARPLASLSASARRP